MTKPTNQAAMAEASRVVLDGFEVRSDAKVIRHPDRYSDGRGERMWQEVFELIEAAGATSGWSASRHARVICASQCQISPDRHDCPRFKPPHGLMVPTHYGDRGFPRWFGFCRRRVALSRRWWA